MKVSAKSRSAVRIPPATTTRRRTNGRSGAASRLAILGKRHAGQVGVEGMAVASMRAQLQARHRDRVRQRLHAIKDVDYLVESDVLQFDINAVFAKAPRHFVIGGRNR